MGSILKNDTFTIASRLRAARRGDTFALYDLGVAYSTGTAGVTYDLVEAHKWFNLAAIGGSDAAQIARAEIAEDMSAREIAIAQRAARDWLVTNRAQAA